MTEVRPAARLEQMGSGAAGELAVTWASRTVRADGKTVPERLTITVDAALEPTL